MAPDTANFRHQLPQKESGGKLYGSGSRQLSHQLPQKDPAENYMAPDPANFVHQLPQKESGEKL
jgi:hypothetical protein